MEKQYKRKKITLRLLIFLLQIFLFCFKTNGLELDIPNTVTEVNTPITIKIVLIKNDYKKILKKKNKIELKSKSDFEILNFSIRETTEQIFTNFEIKINNINENYFYLYLNNTKINNSKIKITTRFQRINPQTKFYWKIFNAEKKEVSEPIEQGNKYFLILYGEFYDDKNKILRVEYEVNHTILVTKNSKLNLKKENLTQVICFEIVALHYEKILLPSIEIFYDDLKKSYNKISIPIKYITTISKDNHSNENFQTKINNSSNLILKKTYSTEQLELAKKFFNLQVELSKNIFQFKKISELIEVKNNLGLKKTFLVIEKNIFLVGIITCIFCFIFLIVKFKFKKLITNIFLLVFFILSVFMLKKFYTDYGVVFSKDEISLKIIPEEDANNTFNLQIGETIIIKKVLNNWYYIKTATNKTGWIEQTDILKID